MFSPHTPKTTELNTLMEVFQNQRTNWNMKKSGKVIYNFRTDFLEMAVAHLKTHHVFKTFHVANI